MADAKLKDLIQSDAAALAASNSDDWVTVAARIATIAPSLRRPVRCSDVRRAASLSGVWAAIQLAGRESSAAPAAIKGVCITFVDWLNNSDTLDVDLPEVRAMAAALVAAGICTQQQIDALIALGDVPQVFTPLECRLAHSGE